MSEARDTAATGPLAAQPNREQITVSPLLMMAGIVKRYGAATALDRVDFTANSGEIHALLGENGAGKSTLMHILSGLTRPDAGEIRLCGESVRLDSPRRARSLGIAMVHQHFTLVPAFTVAENLALDSPHTGIPLNYRPEQAAAKALARAESLGWKLDANARIADLPVGVQQRVEIVKALAADARLIIFDEPTAVLSAEEVEELFSVMRLLKAEGKAVILIAHKLAEILAVADRVTVLRRGVRVASCPVGDTDDSRLAAWMVGERLPQDGIEETRTTLPEPTSPVSLLNSSSSPTDKGEVLRAEGISLRGDRQEIALNNLSLSVCRGEIYGVGGVDGNGQTELAEALVGLRPLAGGTLLWQGSTFLPGQSPTVGYIPQDRRRVGLAVSMSVADNLLFQAALEPEYQRGPFLRTRKLETLAQDLITKFDIRTQSPALLASALSGGNQQKIVVARALRSEPSLIVAVNPTRGLDIHATRFVHEQLRLAKARGAAVVLISTDFDEIALLSDRAGILSAGKLTSFDPTNVDQQTLGLLLGGVLPTQTASTTAGSGGAV